MLNKINLYILKKFFYSFILTFLIFSVILFIGDFVEQFRKSTGKNVSLSIIFQLTLLNFLSLVYFTLPLIVFSSSILAYLGLIKGSEKIIINSVGISNIKITLPAITLYIFLGIFFITIINPLTALFDERYSELEYRYIDRVDKFASITKNGLWLKQDNQEKNLSSVLYAREIKETMAKMDEKKSLYLTQPKLGELSPKFAYMMGNITNPENKGLHMVDSQFRTLEGIGIFSLVLEANGYRQFKLKKNEKNNFEIDIPADHEPGKLYALYTGTETVEEKETMRKIYNSEWSQLPSDLVSQLKDIHTDNFYGELIKVLMITQSGAEGINLKNTRFVHIMEPYWHPVRTKQVIGRARRIRSHDDLPQNMKNVKVFMYLMTFTEEQHKTMPIDIRNNDKSKFDKTNTRALTTDQSLYEISNRKENINRKITRAIKESAMDCALYDHSNENDPIECHTFGINLDPKEYSFVPNMKDEDKTQKINKANQMNVKLEFKKVRLDNIDYAMRVNKDKKPTYFIYTFDSYLENKKNPSKDLVYVGKIQKIGGDFVINTEIKDDITKNI